MSRRPRVIQWLRIDQVEEMQPGREMMVCYEPARPNRVAIEVPEHLNVG